MLISAIYTILFTGSADKETVLNFAQARYLNSGFGRFTSPDAPFADQIEHDAQSWNLYVYVRNNPLTYTDPTGFWVKVDCIGGATMCYMAEEGDTYESLAEITGLSPENLREFFRNQEIVTGDVFDTSDYGNWLQQGANSGISRVTQRQLNDILHKHSNIEPPMGGGLKFINKSKAGIFSRVFKWGKKILGFADETSVSAKSLAQYQKLKQLYRSLMSKPPVTDPALKSLMDDLYRANATVGSGSTAAAVRQEIATGQPVGNVFHTQKANDYIVALERWLKNNPSAAASDRHAAEQVILDLKNALGL